MSRTLAFFLIACSVGIEASQARANRSTHDARRALLSRPAGSSYVVGEETTLGEISLRLYGTSKRWKEIADWNQLGEPFILEPGQKLVLKEPPAVSDARGKKLLLEMWRRRLERGRREELKPETPPAAVAPTVSPSPPPPPAGLSPTGLSEEEREELRKEAEEAAALARRKAEAEAEALRIAERERKARELEAEAERLRQEQESAKSERRRAELEAERKRLETAKLAEEARIAKEKAAREEMEKRRQAELLAQVAREAEAKGEVEAPSSAERLLVEAQAAFKEKRFVEAAELARRSRRMNPEPMVTWILEIRSWISAGRMEEARESARPFFEAHPEARRFPFFKALGEIQ